MIVSDLEKIGLTKNEAKVYITLLKLGMSKAGVISKNAGINRTTTYDCLNGLIDKGLVSFVVESKHKVFKPVSPERLLDFVKEKELQVQKLLPDLKKFYKTPEKKHNVTLYKGYKGIKSVFQDFISSTGEDGTIRVMDSEGQFTKRMPYYSPHYIKQVEDNNIKIKHIVRKGRDIKPTKTTRVRFIDKLESDAVINVYADKIAILLWTNPPEAVVIENESLNKSLEYYFEKIWKNIK